jgi:hypothetical protein
VSTAKAVQGTTLRANKEYINGIYYSVTEVELSYIASPGERSVALIPDCRKSVTEGLSAGAKDVEIATKGCWDGHGIISEPLPTIFRSCCWVSGAAVAAESAAEAVAAKGLSCDECHCAT